MKLSIVFLLFYAASVDSLSIECNFALSYDNLYTCTNINLKLEKNNEDIKNVLGNHWHGRDDSSVSAIYFLSGEMRNLPRGVFKVFKNLEKYVVQGLDTLDEFPDNEALIRGDFNGGGHLGAIVFISVSLDHLKAKVFEGASNLNHLTIEACRIKSVDKEAFLGLRKLHSLGLKFNYITSLHPSTFSDLVELKHLLLSGNHLEKITKDHFKSMKKLIRISLISNVLEEIDQDLIDGLPELENIHLDSNLCVDEHFGYDGVPMSKFKKLISLCYKSSVEEDRHVNEIKELEHEVATLQKIVEKYKAKNCDQTMKIGGGAGDLMWMKRRESP